ncbi:MAG: 16S rRNA (adenine(1518)-N(6)/adenine(1519)-N(6))-dimethyltransferase RsmA [Dehalococcoidales bacterium]|nr:16S rRNA (adenine(1518)-N(6)/adenine(1519)-N(6))-dimethyltransferase RsmA [Dehalococcoidales bacterium]
MIHQKYYSEPQSLLAQVKGMLRHFDLRARKSLGQHFLIDEEVLKSITAAAELEATDVVMEVGPGFGVLTKALAEQSGCVIAVELDNNLVGILSQTLASFTNVAIVNRDILQVDPKELLREQEDKFPTIINSPFSYKVVANLPYYITSIALRHFLEASLKPEVMVIMVQKEVAQAIVAKPGQMGILSISVQFYGRPSIISYVPASSFYPVPEVDSAIVKIDLYNQPLIDVTDSDSFFNLVRAGFSAPRKQIGNSLARGLKRPKSDVISLLERVGIVANRRAETLALDEWVKLWQICTQFDEHVKY